MSIGTKNYGSYMGQGRTGLRSKKICERRHARRVELICPFTLEAISDCATRQKSPNSRCRFSLEGCQARRLDRRRFKIA